MLPVRFGKLIVSSRCSNRLEPCHALPDAAFGGCNPQRLIAAPDGVDAQFADQDAARHLAEAVEEIAGDHDILTEFLGQPFEPARRVERVPEGGDLAPFEPDLSRDDLSAVECGPGGRDLGRRSYANRRPKAGRSAAIA